MGKVSRKFSISKKFPICQFVKFSNTVPGSSKYFRFVKGFIFNQTFVKCFDRCRFVDLKAAVMKEPSAPTFENLLEKISRFQFESDKSIPFAKVSPVI